MRADDEPAFAAVLAEQELPGEKWLNRSEQAAFLKERGFPTAKSTLQKFATVGGGPEYVLFGNKALSKPEWLLRWAKGRLSSPRRSTSEVRR